MRSVLLITVFIVSSGILFFSCKKETKIIYRPVAADSSYVSITNASPVISNLLFFVDNQSVHLPDSPLSFGYTTFATYINAGNEINPSVQTLPYIKIPNGYRQLGFNSYSPNVSFLVTNYFATGGNYSVFITDTVNHGQLKSVILKDNIQKGDTSTGQVRFLNLSPDAPALDVYAFLNAGPNGVKIFSGCGYLPNDYNSVINGQSFIKMPVGAYYFVATVSETYNVVLEGGLIIQPQSVVSIYSKGFVAGTGANAIDVGVISYTQK